MIPPTLAANPRLDRWVGFEPDGAVRVAFGKVEYGQGAVTALAQIAAEELDVAMGRLRVVNAETGVSPDEGMTVGSMSIEMSGWSLRTACAEVRALALAEAAGRLGCEPAALTIEDGAVHRDGKPTGQDYWSLNLDLARDATGEAQPKPVSEHRVVGRSQPRLDLPAKLFGGGFIQDMRPAGMLHARVLRQPGAKARLVSLDEAAVRRAASADVTILRDASFLAFVSESETAAVQALTAAERLAVWEGARVLDPAQSEADSLKTMPAADHSEGPPPAEPSNRRRHQAGYSRPYIFHASMAPGCGLAEFRDGRLTVWTHAQGVYPMRAMLARVSGLDPEAITVHHAQAAGNYGHNGSDDAAVDAAVIALRTPGRPIRVQWRREDEFGYAPVGTAMHIEMSAELDEQGALVDFSTEIWSGRHVGRGLALAETALPPKEAPPPAPPNPAMAAFSGGRLNAVPSYAIPAARVTEHTVAPSPIRTSSLRGLGGPVNTYAGECFIDELAGIAGADPVAYRLAMLPDPRARAVVERCAAMANWSRRGEAGSGTGLGFGYSRHRDRGAMVAVVVEAQVADEVRLKHVWCAADCGLIVNPDGARNQIEGGIIMALSWALKEQVRLGEGGVATLTWTDYPILRFSEVPPVDIDLLASDDRPMGIGEVSFGPALGAIGNALAHAWGARVRELPFTRDRVARSLLA